MLAGIYYGAQYGGSTTAILVNLPGEARRRSPRSTATRWRARARRPGPGHGRDRLVLRRHRGDRLIALFAPPLASVALQFGPAEYFSLMVLGLVCAVALAHGSLLQGARPWSCWACSSASSAPTSTPARRASLSACPSSPTASSFVAVAMGMFGLAEIIRNLENETDALGRWSPRSSGLWPTRDGLRASSAPIMRGTALGSVLGILPGGGAILLVRRPTRWRSGSRRHRRFGKGAIEGVAAPESANNAGAQTSFIPMLTSGIPSNPVMALMIGAMMIQGISPGPTVITEQPALFWGLIVSMWIGNLMLIVLNLPLIGIWVRLLRCPTTVLFPAILAFCCIGVYSINNSDLRSLLMALFGLLGYLFVKLDCEPAPLLLGFILGPMMEEHFRRAMIIVAATRWSSSPARSARPAGPRGRALVFVILPAIRQKRDEAFQEES